MYEWLPSDVELMTDTSQADWVVSALRPWDEDGVRVGSFMPEVFETYARIDRVGLLDERQARRYAALVSELSLRARADNACWFCLWDGWGSWWKGAHGPLTSRSASDGSGAQRRQLREAARRERRIDDERDSVLRHTPRVGTEQRSYFLVRGPLSAAVPLAEATGGEAPNLWWPSDHSWLVSTEIDGEATYVGGSAELIGALLAPSELAATETTVWASLA